MGLFTEDEIVYHLLTLSLQIRIVFASSVLNQIIKSKIFHESLIHKLEAKVKTTLGSGMVNPLRTTYRLVKTNEVSIFKPVREWQFLRG